jgi:hypothetical protein
MPRIIPKTSVKYHFITIVEGEERKRKCKYCANRYAYSTAPDNLEKHLSIHPTEYRDYLAIKPRHSSQTAGINHNFDEPHPRITENTIDLAPTVNNFIRNDNISYDIDRSDSFSAISNVSSSTSSSPKSFISSRQILSTSVKEFQAAEFHEKLALCFATHSLPHILLESEIFIDLMRSANSYQCKLPNRKQLKARMQSIAERYTNEMIDNAASCLIPSALAIDGWTNCRQGKIINILLLSQNNPYFLRSCDSEHESVNAEFLYATIKPIIDGLHHRNIKIVGIVMDNASVNGKLYNDLIIDFPHFIRLPCAAHIIQLCVHRILLIPELKVVIDFMELILKEFRANSFPYSRLQKVQMDEEDLIDGDNVPNANEINLVDDEVSITAKKGNVLTLRRPNDTRWSSSLMAAERILQLKPYIIKVANRYCRRIIEEDEKNNLWDKLNALALMLDPFRRATDVLQSDSSTLYTVYLEFTKILLAIQKFPVDVLHVDVKAIKSIIVSYWKKHVNINAVIMSARLSFDSCYKDVFDTYGESALTESKHWFMSFGVNYIMYYKKPTDTRTRDEIYLKLMKQYGDLMLMSPPFSKYSKYINNIKDGVKPKDNETSVDAMQLWGFVGDEVPELAQCAVALLTLPASEAAVERSFSQQGMVHRPVRNRMTSKQIECEMRIRFNSKENAKKGSKKSSLSNEPMNIDEINDYNETAGRLFEIDDEIIDELANIDADIELEEMNGASCPSKKRKQNDYSPIQANTSHTVDAAESSSPLISAPKRQKPNKVPAQQRPRITKVSDRAERIIPYEEINNLNDFVKSYVQEKQMVSIPIWNSNTNTHLDAALASWPKQIKDCTEEVRKRIATYIKSQQLQQNQTVISESTVDSPSSPSLPLQQDNHSNGNASSPDSAPEPSNSCIL